MSLRAKKGTHLFLMFILAAPLLQQWLHIFNTQSLHGYFEIATDTTFTWTGWFDGSYQKKKIAYVNDNLGFRNDLVRVNGQIDYSMFLKANYGGTDVGRDGYLFYDNYVDAYYGRDYAGYARLHDVMSKMKAVQDTLNKMGKTFVMVYAPCKAWYLSEYIADYMKPTGATPAGNNYVTCKRIGDSIGVHQIDFNGWFLKLRDTTRELLYSRKGIHWTNYGSILAADSLISYLEAHSHIRMPHPLWDSVEHTNTPRSPDNDMAQILNLIVPMRSETYCYPYLHYTHPDAPLPHAIFIGDSYNNNFMETGIIQSTNNADWQVWYYFKYVFRNSNYGSQDEPMSKHDWKGDLAKADYIVILNTSISDNDPGNGFVEAAYQYFYPNKN
jgi:SGNH hydrolase-like domain, acetyltransferase AlgX